MSDLSDPLNWPAPEPKFSAAETLVWCNCCGRIFGLPNTETLSNFGILRQEAKRIYIRHYYREHVNRNWSA